MIIITVFLKLVKFINSTPVLTYQCHLFLRSSAHTPFTPGGYTCDQSSETEACTGVLGGHDSPQNRRAGNTKKRFSAITSYLYHGNSQ